MMRKTRHVSVCVNSSARGVFSSCSSCVTAPRPGSKSSSVCFVSAIRWGLGAGGEGLVRACLFQPTPSPQPLAPALKGHDVVAAVHVEDFAGDAGGEGAEEEEGRVADLARLDVAAQ